MSLSTDVDVLGMDPYAAGYLPSGESTFERLRELAYADLTARLDVMQPAVSPTATRALINAEVYCVLHMLYRESAARTKEGHLWDVSQYWLRCYDRATAAVDAGDVPAVRTTRVWRV